MYRLWIVLVLMTSGFALPLRATDDRPSAPVAAIESTAADPAPASDAVAMILADALCYTSAGTIRTLAARADVQRSPGR